MGDKVADRARDGDLRRDERTEYGRRIELTSVRKENLYKERGFEEIDL